jgi:hypothetical protein
LRISVGKRTGLLFSVSTAALLLTCSFLFLGLLVSKPVELAILTDPSEAATAWEPYEYRAKATEPVFWSLSSSQHGINISSAGLVYGIFTETGNASISLKVTNDAGRSVFQNFSIQITANPLGTPEFSFAGASDGHLSERGNPDGRMQVALLKSVKARSLEMVFDLGDLVTGDIGTGIGASISNYTTIKENYDRAGIPYHVSMGNHDNLEAFNAVFPGSLDYFVVRDKMIMIVLNASLWPVAGLNDTQLRFLNDTLNSHKDSLAFVMCHEGRKQFHWPAGYPNGEANDIRFQQIIESNSYHMGGVLVGHAHSTGSTAGNGTYYSYTGTYGSVYQNGFNTPMGYATFGVFKNATSGYTIKVWYESLVNEAALPLTYIQYDVPGPK